MQQLRSRNGGRQIGNIFMWVSVIRVACSDMTHRCPGLVSSHVTMSVMPGPLATSCQAFIHLNQFSLEFAHLFAMEYFREKKKCFIFIFAVLDVTIDHFDCSCCNHPNIILSLNSRIVLTSISSLLANLFHT